MNKWFRENIKVGAICLFSQLRENGFTSTEAIETLVKGEIAVPVYRLVETNTWTTQLSSFRASPEEIEVALMRVAPGDTRRTL